MRWSEAQLVDYQTRRGRAVLPASGSASRAPARSSGKKPPTVRLEASETEAHIALVGHLQMRCRPGIHWHHPATGELRDAATAAKLQRMGVRPGLPDFLFLIAGRLHGLELKREHGGRVSAEQVAMHGELVAAGAVVAVARGLDEALRVLTSWGVFDPQSRS